MPQFTGVGDLTFNNKSLGRLNESYRPLASTTYLPGSVLQLAPSDTQIYPDYKTVRLSVAQANTVVSQRLFCGVVAGAWPGFAGSIGAPSYTSPASGARGTQLIESVCKGVAGILVDQSGSGAVTLVHGGALVTSVATAGYAQGGADTVAVVPIAVAVLPASGIGSSITAAALAQAVAVFTVASPAAGDTVNTTIQAPYTETAPGVVQTATWSLTLTSATAASATTAGNAIVAFLNAQPNFAQYFTATNTAGAVSVTVNALSTPFLITYGSGTTLTNSFSLGLSGMIANTLTTVGSVTGSGGTTYSAGAATFNGGTPGTGYKGLVPAMIYGAF